MRRKQGIEVAILLLAAGPSRRLGSPKQLLQFKNRTLLRYCAETAVASKGHHTLVVVGAEGTRVGKEVADLPVTVVHNPDWEEGIASSIRAGVAAAGDTAKAILIMLCDQPRVTTGLLDEIISAYLSSGKRIVACEYGGTLGAPALFDHSLVSELTGLRGDRGAKQVIAEHPADVHRITFPGGVVDIDTTDDYRSLVT